MKSLSGTYHRKIDGDAIVGKNDKLILYGMVSGNLTVSESGVLELHGMVAKNLIVKDNGCAIIQGMVSGNLICEGGSTEVYGTIVNKIFRQGGSILIDDNALINKKRGYEINR